jgi:translocation and assembly module TamA
MTFVRRLLTWLPAAALALPPAWAGVDVVVTGVEGPERDNVEASLTIRTYVEGGGEDEAQLRRLHRQAEKEIRAALMAYGYYEPAVRSSLQQQDDDFEARYEIEVGPPTLLADVKLGVTGEGAGLAELQAALARSALQPGERLRHEEYENTKGALARAAYEGGFLDARFTAHALRVAPADRRADVVLTLDTGPRYYFGEVSVAQEGLDPGFVARYVPIVPGEPFAPAKLLQAQFVLSDLGYFGSVDVQPQRERAVDRRVPIVIATTPRPPRRYDAGVGYGTDTGARLTLGAEFRQLTESGHKLRSDLRVSEVKDSIGFDYRVPLGTRAGENLGFATAYTDEKIGDGDSQRYDFAVTLSRTPGDWQRQLYVKHTYEQSFVPATGTDSSKLLLPGVTLSRGEMDDPIHARLGWSLFLDGHGGHEAVVSDVSFLQGKALLRGVVPLGARARLLARAEFGGTLIDDFRELPASQRFFAGGDQSVRGYSYQSLAPRDAAGKTLGGKFLTTYSVEAEYRVWRNWGAAVFFDTGNADDDPWPRLYSGVGIGVRYRAPIGTVQVDLAHPLAEDGVRPHLGIRVGL